MVTNFLFEITGSLFKIYWAGHIYTEVHRLSRRFGPAVHYGKLGASSAHELHVVQTAPPAQQCSLSECRVAGGGQTAGSAEGGEWWRQTPKEETFALFLPNGHCKIQVLLRMC